MPVWVIFIKLEVLLLIRHCVSPRSFEHILLVAITSAPRQFNILQQRMFPACFKLNTLISSGFLLAWIRSHNTVPAHFAYPTAPDVFRTYVLFVAVGLQTQSLVWIGPATDRVLAERLQLEITKGKNAQCRSQLSPVAANRVLKRRQTCRLSRRNLPGCTGIALSLT